jgi:hypothetical protein
MCMKLEALIIVLYLHYFILQEIISMFLGTYSFGWIMWNILHGEIYVFKDNFNSNLYLVQSNPQVINEFNVNFPSTFWMHVNYLKVQKKISKFLSFEAQRQTQSNKLG